MHIDDIDTPALVLDLDVCERNIRRFQRLFDEYGVGFRPHIKTHKIPELARWQMDAGAIGITCQKLGEVEVMSNAGLDNILLYFNIVGEPKLERLCRLSQACDLTVTADSPIVTDAIGAVAVRRGVVVNVLAELNSFIDRTGVPSVSELVDLAKHIDRTPGLNLRGMATYPTGRQSADRIAEAIRAFDQAGLNREIVSGGGTPTAFEAEAVNGLTEHRAGTYIFMDRQCIDRGVATEADCALQVLTTVVSNPVRERAVIDGGTKTFSADGAMPRGLVLGFPGAEIYQTNEEHGYLDIGNCDPRPSIGDRIRVIPNHVCVTVNLHNQVYGCRGNEVEQIWSVAARGLVQ